MPAIVGSAPRLLSRPIIERISSSQSFRHKRYQELTAALDRRCPLPVQEYIRSLWESLVGVNATSWVGEVSLPLENVEMRKSDLTYARVCNPHNVSDGIHDDPFFHKQGL
jgi:hypothetical protein